MVELVVVAALVSILVIGVVGLFMSLLQGQSKTSILAKIKEEGDYASSTIERRLRDGKDVVENITMPNNCVSPTQIQVVKSDGTVLTIESQGGAILVDAQPITSSSELTVTDVVFKCMEDTSPGGHDKVLVALTLSDLNGQISVPFSTYVVLRNN